MTLLDILIMFGTCFLQVFLLGLQSKNVNQGRYAAAVVTSFGISVANFTFVKYAAGGSMTAFVSTSVGGCCGIAASIWFYKNFMERKGNGKPNRNRPAAKQKPRRKWVANGL